MSRKIYCSECKTFLGEIRDAKLKKNMACLCSKCESARKLMKTAVGIKGNSNPLGDMFGGMFK